jgi:hypothetical protein
MRTGEPPSLQTVSGLPRESSWAGWPPFVISIRMGAWRREPLIREFWLSGFRYAQQTVIMES